MGFIHIFYSIYFSYKPRVDIVKKISDDIRYLIVLKKLNGELMTFLPISLLCSTANLMI